MVEVEQVAQSNGQLPARVEPGVLLQLSNEMVRIYKEIFGRGPTRARVDWAGPDTILCTLEDSLTPAERKLAELGEHERLRDTRTFFQHACEADFRESVERTTGRKVRAFVSGIDTDAGRVLRGVLLRAGNGLASAVSVSASAVRAHEIQRDCLRDYQPWDGFQDRS